MGKTNQVTTLIVAFLAVHPLHAMVLDHGAKKSRSICGASPQEVSPLEESILRGECEPFAQGVGKIVVKGDMFTSQGTGILVAPNVVLTAAHVVKKCLSKRVSCVFELFQNTKFAGDLDVKIPISEAYIPKQYLDLTNRIDQLELESTKLEELKIKGEGEFLGEKIKSVHDEISLYKKNMGNYDLALVKLKGKIELGSYIQIFNADISRKFDSGSRQVFGVSSQRIKTNDTGGYIPEYDKDKRHIGVFTMDLAYKNDINPLVASYTLPGDYHATCKVVTSGEKGVYPDRFLYHPTTDSFLKSITQPGDSGGPLIAKIGSKYVIVGVAQQVNFGQCVEKKGASLAPGGTFFNLWTPTFNHLSWIKQKLKDLDASAYQSKLGSKEK